MKRPLRYAVREMVAAGKTDGEIAEAMGVTKSAVRSARGRLGLPVNLPPLTTASMRDQAIRALHAKGLTDRQIATEMELSDETIGLYRWRLGLKPNARPRLYERIAKAVNDAARAGHRVRNIELAARFGITEKHVAKQLHNLRTKGLIPDDRSIKWRTHARHGVAQSSGGPRPVPGGLQGDGGHHAAHGAD